MKYPKPIQNMIDKLSRLPSVGPKTAERYVFYLLSLDSKELNELARSLQELKERTTLCRICRQISESSPCPICSDKERDPKLLCVVADTRDLAAVEATRQYKGLYLVLGGELDPVKGIKPDRLNIKPLIERMQSRSINEVILALNPTIEGETTSLYLSGLIKERFGGKIRITRIARGLPMGADLEYADEITLSNALKYRNEF